MITDFRCLFLSLAWLLVAPISVHAITRVSTTKDCYEPGDDIRINFQSDSPTVHDWVSIVPPSAALDPFLSDLAVDWTRTCGTKECNPTNPRTAGSVTLPTTFVQRGTWKVILVTTGPGIWVGVAQSQTFELQSAGLCSTGGGGGPKPSRAPTLRPTRTDATLTAMPTFAPIDQSSSSSISTNKVNYAFNENIRVTFQTANPRIDDWVGIVTPSTSANNLVGGEFWMWVCGGQVACAEMVGQGTLVFGPGGEEEGWDQTWPPRNGAYKAFLARNAAQPPYQVIAESNVFSVSAGSTPTLAPTRPAPLPSTFISTNERSYFAHEEITVNFSNASPQNGDWIGIFRSSEPSDNLQDGELWTFVCGNIERCSGPRGSGTVVFGPNGDHAGWNQRWPLRGGTYKAVLARSGFRPWPFVVESAVFTVIDLSAMVEDTANDIRVLIGQEPGLGPKFVRLGFHDCVGGCDGCVDMLNADNAGLDLPISSLRPIVQEHENDALGFSRADIWALAALVGADEAQPFPIVDFTLTSIGRVNCEDAMDRCFDSEGALTPCRGNRGPHRELPHADITTDDLFHFFRDNFRFGVKETVALFGAHTLGVLSRENSGFNGPDGWVREETVLDNEYYFELMGLIDGSIPFEDQVDLAPPWFRAFEDNSDLPGIPDRHVWEAFPEGRNGQRILMLNADVALVRELDHDNMAKDGRVSCAFIGQGRCPHAARSLNFAAEYFLDNNLWLNDFQDVFTKMLVNGYARSGNCFGELCYLLPA